MNITHVDEPQVRVYLRLLILFIISTLLATTATTPATADPALEQDFGKFRAADATQAEFDSALQYYLTINQGAGGAELFDLEQANRDGASKDLLDLGKQYNMIALAYTDAENPKSDLTTKASIPIWGNWCGPGYGGGTPIDVLDTACQAHDKCYASRGYFDCLCDYRLIAAINSGWGRMRATEKIAATGVKAYFSAQRKVNGC